MRILLTNDDGYKNEGILALRDALRDIADLTIAAPLIERSGASSSVTIHSPLRFEKYRYGDIDTYAVDGTPTDAVKLALSKFVEDMPDLIISGINRGPNIGTNILYSGTVGGAIEGAIWGIPSIAISLAGFMKHDFLSTQEFIREYITGEDIKMIKKGTILNINIPAIEGDKIKGMRYTTVSKFSFLENYEERVDPFNKPYYWLADFDRAGCSDTFSDLNALVDGYISISPINIDMTDRAFLTDLNSRK